MIITKRRIKKCALLRPCDCLWWYELSQQLYLVIRVLHKGETITQRGTTGNTVVVTVQRGQEESVFFTSAAGGWFEVTDRDNARAIVYDPFSG